MLLLSSLAHSFVPWKVKGPWSSQRTEAAGGFSSLIGDLFQQILSSLLCHESFDISNLFNEAHHFFQTSKCLNSSTFKPPSRALTKVLNPTLWKSGTPDPVPFGPTRGHAFLGSAGVCESAPLMYYPSPPFLSAAFAYCTPDPHYWFFNEKRKRRQILGKTSIVS